MLVNADTNSEQQSPRSFNMWIAHDCNAYIHSHTYIHTYIHTYKGETTAADKAAAAAADKAAVSEAAASAADRQAAGYAGIVRRSIYTRAFANAPSFSFIIIIFNTDRAVLILPRQYQY